MFTYNGRDAHRNLVAARVHLPPKGQIVDILPERTKTEDDEVRIEYFALGLAVLSLYVGGSCSAAPSRSWTARYLGASLRATHAPGV